MTVILPNGNEVVANGRLALMRIQKRWREQYMGSNEHPTLGFPFTVILDDGTEQVIDDQVELDELLESCAG